VQADGADGADGSNDLCVVDATGEDPIVESEGICSGTCGREGPIFGWEGIISTNSPYAGLDDGAGGFACTWTLRAAEDASTISIEFTAFHTQLIQDTVQIYSCSDDDCSDPQSIGGPMDGKLEGNKIVRRPAYGMMVQSWPAEYRSSHRVMKVYFRADRWLSAYAGFTAKWSSEWAAASSPSCVPYTDTL